MKFSLESLITFNPPKATSLSDTQRLRKYVILYDKPTILDFRIADAMINHFRG